MSCFRKQRISDTNEMVRIRALPRLNMAEGEVNELVEGLTGALKKRAGTMKLRPIQARALHAIGCYGGAFCAMRVGGGKTLVSGLAPYVLEARNAVLLVPASLQKKTEDDFAELSRHWLVSGKIRIVSYQALGRVNASKLLDEYKPDLIIADEVHKLKNKKAACTRRVSRYMHDHPETKFVALSGTIMKDSIRDFAHIVAWCLKGGAPIPLESKEILEWADALDERLQNPMNRLDPGPLLSFANDEDWKAGEGDETRVARRGFRRRFTETPGIVATSNEQVDCKLRIQALEFEPDDVTEENFQKLRKEWLTPDDWPLSMATEVWAVAGQLTAGFHYVWAPRPPDEWRNARRDWCAYVREVLAHARHIDTELQVRNEVLNGERPDGEAFLREWKAQEPTFKINVKPVWHDDTVLDICAKWMKGGPGIVWTQHAFFAQELAKRTGRPYYGQKGLDAQGRSIKEADPKDGPIIASIAACGTGQNLQAWRRNLVTACPTSSEIWEQLLGRTHRDGQLSDIVTVELLIGCKENWNAWVAALAGAQAALDTTGMSQKLLDCDVVGFPDEDEIVDRAGWRWGNDPEKVAKG